jgi:hypothetical protein
MLFFTFGNLGVLGIFLVCPLPVPPPQLAAPCLLVVGGSKTGRLLRVSENGELVAERDASVNKTPWTQNLVIGQYSGQIAPDFQVKGRIKDVRIW